MIHYNRVPKVTLALRGLKLISAQSYSKKCFCDNYTAFCHENGHGPLIEK
jgi:hypothetical protein